MPANRLCWMVGGPQGSGVDSAARLFALTLARAGLEVVGQREYYSNIKGEHSYYKILVDEKAIRAPIRDVHFLTSYDAETAVRHGWVHEVVAGGVFIYDAAQQDDVVEKVGTLDRRVKDEIKKELGEEATVGDVVAREKDRGVIPVPFPYKETLAAVGSRLGLGDSGKLLILKNTVAVGATLGALRFDRAVLEEQIRATFEGKKQQVIEMNLVAAEEAAKRAQEICPQVNFQLRPLQRRRPRMFLQGTQAVAMGKVVAGCRFQTYYPISPATDESVFLESHPETDVVVVQTEDEMAAMVMATGAALTGARASTSTSGPGACLMVESLGWAGICEVPVVVVDYQRAGPSTGLPTRTEQGDLRFLLHAGHGEFPRLILAPGDIEELFFDTVDAFNWAERYQTPVILLADKALAGNSFTAPPFDTATARVERGAMQTDEQLARLSKDGIFERFQFSDDGISRRSVLGQKGGIHWLTGDEHTEVGHITEDPVIRDRMMEKRMQKLHTAAGEIPADRKVRVVGPQEAELTVLTWGSPKGAVLDAMDQLNAQRPRIRLVQVRVMSPFPQAEVHAALKDRRVLCLESNYSGQLAGLVRQETGIAVAHVAVKYNGRPVLVDEVVDAVEAALKGQDRIVLREGV